MMIRGQGARDDVRWWRGGLSRDERAESIASAVRLLDDQQSARVSSLTRAARLYGDLPALALGPSVYSAPSAPAYGVLALNVVRAVVNAACAMLFAGTVPRAWFVTTGGDYDARRRAKLRTKFVAGVMYHAEFDALARRAATHSALFGKGILHVLEVGDEVGVELVYPWELFTDERDAYYGQPRCMYRVRWVDRAVLQERYPRAKGLADVTSSEDGASSQWRDALSDQVRVCEAWHLPSAKGATDGRYTVAVEDVVLDDREYSNGTFPFVDLNWSDPVIGHWPRGLGDELTGTQYAINQTIERIDCCFKLMAAPRVWLERQARVAPGQLNNQPGNVVQYTGRPPVFEAAAVVSPQMLAHLDGLVSRAFQFSGISEIAAMAMKPAGLNSGVALRAYADMTSQRFSGWQRAWHDFYRRAADQIVRCQQRIADRVGDVVVEYHDEKQRSVEPIRWSDAAERPDEHFVLQAHPVSSLPSSPAGRLAAAQELANAGLISPADFRRLAADPDLEAIDSLEQAPRELLEKVFERMLYGTADDPADDYVGPEGFMPLELGFRLAGLYYLRAKLENVPEERLQLVRDWMAVAEMQMEPPAPPPNLPPSMPPEAADAPPPPPAPAG